MAGKVLLTAALAATALAAPLLEERQSCGAVWSQCGGNGFSGATTCCSGSTCVKQNDWYSQCLPGAAVTTTAQVPTPTPTRSSSSSSSSSTRASSSTTSSPAGPVVTPTTTASPVVPNPGSGATASYSGNPFQGVTMWANSYYSSEVHSLAIPSMTGPMATKAAEVAKVPSFQWLDRNITLSTLLPGTLAEIRAANQAGGNYAAIIVVYDLPDRDCAAAASNGEFALANNGKEHYKTYINEIRRQIQAFSDIRTILVIEPDSLANMITNMDVPKCQGAAAAYKELTIYAMKQLNLPNVAMYLDGGHGGWLGWPANIGPAADMYSEIYRDAGKPAAVRGLAVNVANYNAWSLATAPAYTTPNPNFDEKRYIEAFGPLLNAGGFPAKFIVDQGRSGKQPTGQIEQGHWCNAIGTGFGMRPTANTGHELADAFVWIKPGGESDGTSNTSAARYDYHCGYPDALKPAPEAGQWFQAYFEQLLTNANPAF